MKILKKNVYYCDFCGKKSLRSLKSHEEHCTANPDRRCRLCEDALELRPIINNLKSKISIEGIDENIKVISAPTLDDILKITVCPNCVLTILRCTGLNRYYFGIKYDYKAKLESYWEARREECLGEY